MMKKPHSCVYVVNLRCMVLVCVLTLVLFAYLSRMSDLQVVQYRFFSRKASGSMAANNVHG